MSRRRLAGLLDGQHLTRRQARDLMSRIMSGRIEPVLLAALLAALRLKGETVAEITGFVEAMRARAVPVPVDRRPLIDTCGTGGDGSGTVNLSTATAIVTASLGIAVAKHGNRAVSSRAGSADVLEALGVNVAGDPAAVGRQIDEVGLGFLFAPRLHPAMKHAVEVRRALGVRTVFNLLGPLTNPAGATRQLLGVYDAALCEPLARVLANLGCERAFVVHGAGGLDEVSPCGATHVAEVDRGQVRRFDFRPHEAGLDICAPADLRGGSAAENAAILRDVLAGRPGPVADAVVLNTAFAAVLGGRADGFETGAALAREALASGRAETLLRRLVTASAAVVKEAS